MKREQMKIRVWFAITALSVAFVLCFGVIATHDNVYLRVAYMYKALAYYPYRIEYLISHTLFARASESSVSAHAQEIPVLLYHGIVTIPDGANVLAKDFKEQLFALKAAGYETVTLAQFNAYLDGEMELPDRSIVLTFDDGRKDSFYPVDPILHALKYNAVEFVITRYTLADKNEKKKFYLSAAEFRAMLGTGRWELESHTRDGHDSYPIDALGGEGHFLSNRLWLENENRLETREEYVMRVYRDLLAARDDLKNSLGVSATSFAFPFGDFGRNESNVSGAEEIINHVVGKLYKHVYYQSWGGDGDSHNRPQKNMLMVRRINVSPSWSGEELVRVLEAGRNKSLPYAHTPIDTYEWRRFWGIITVEKNVLELKSPADSDSAAAYLNGSSAWKNYRVTVDAELRAGTSFSVLSRVKDGEQYISCNFTDDNMTIETRVGDAVYLTYARRPVSLSKEHHELGMKVSGKKVSCILDGKEVMKKSNIPGELSVGGVGFKTWGQKNGESFMLVHNVRVEEI